ncbi:MAG: tRNA (adenosine(37)-N6)-dimethylallyltransferase MiaA [Bacteroidota bacterium]
MNKKVIIITGPTAVGKTAVAIDVAKYFQTEIISADSRQCFHELNIGVARPSLEELQQVPHHFIASHSIHQTLSAADFEEYALNKVAKIFEKNDFVVMAGGTGLYIKAFMQGLDAIPDVPSTIRKNISVQYEQKGMEWLKSQLQDMDPLYASEGEMQNPQRMMRALEVVTATQQSILSFRRQQIKQRDFEVIVVQLVLPRELLYQRINARVDQMLNQGLLEEVEKLYHSRHLNALQTVGYSEIFDYMEGKFSIDDSIDKIKQHTRHYAKRQMTWFKHQLTSASFHPDDRNGLIDLLRQEMNQ